MDPSASVGVILAGSGHLLAARVQMAFTLGTHVFVACLGVGMPVLLLFAEWRHLRTGDPIWKTLARRWARAFAVLFAVGAVSGTVLSFELGLLWPEFMGTFGSVIGMPFTLEAFAFFIEAIFLGIYLYGWDRLSPRTHLLTGLPVALSGLASVWFVVSANAWMNAPTGFRMEAGEVVAVDPVGAMFNPAVWAQTTHMILAAYMVTGFVIASVYAVHILRGERGAYHRRAMALGLAMGTILAPAQAVVGHQAARMVARTQPVKLAAMEGQFRTETRAPLRIGGLPDMEARRTPYAIEIPGLLSWLAYGELDATVRGLDDFPRDEIPPAPIVHVAFQLMVSIGTGLLILSVWTGVSLLLRRRLPAGRLYLWAIVASGPLVALALEAGWTVTEVGRQPWIVQGVMRTSDAVTEAPGVGWSLAGALAIYAVLACGTVIVLRQLAGIPLPEVERGT